MTFPANANIDVSKFDSASDKISESRPELEKMAGYVNDIIEAGPFDSGRDLITDTSPQLGGNLDVNGFSITGPFDPITIESDIININASSVATIDSFLLVTDGASIQDGVLESNTISTDTNPKSIGLSVEVDNSADSITPARMSAIWINGSYNGDEIALSVNNVETIAGGGRTLDGYIMIRVNGGIRYLPYYF